ncbi:MAG: cytochrome P450 [Chloroflexi bacterium]|nr:cytochrome P450 [Chloroflexota bacterium]
MATETGSVVFNPFDPKFRANPYPTYKRLLEEAPVFQSPLGVVLSRHRDCESVLRNHRKWSSDLRNATDSGFEPNLDLFDLDRPFLFLDPPDHTRLRSLVSRAFTPRVVEELRARVQVIVDDLLNAVSEQGIMEVIDDFAHPLPVIVISEMLGVPSQSHSQFREWSAELAKSLDPELAAQPEAVERQRRAIALFDDLFKELIAERRDKPKGDLLSALVQAEEEGDKLTEGELLSTCRLILIAGHETTVNLIGNGVLQLLRHPDELQKLRDDPSLAGSAVEEILRYDPPVQLTGRIALEDMEFDGVAVPKGHGVTCLIGAANRDPERFPDPETFDITRGDDRHLSFGFGIHFCIGAPLARVEGQVALATFVRRLKSPELLTKSPKYKNFVLRGLESLSVEFGGMRPAGQR